MTRSKKPCEAEFVPDDDSNPTLTCDREGLHVVHRDPSTHSKHLRAPGGAYVIEEK
jgi:hypothetical protein